MLVSKVADKVLQFPNAEPFDPTSFVLQAQKDAQNKAILGIDQNADDGARAMDLSQASGVPASLIHTDLESFERNHRAAITAELLRNNQYLADYANAHPLASVVSNDDWSNLDAYTSALAKVGLTSTSGRAIRTTLHGIDPGGGIARKAVEGFNAGFGEDTTEPEVHRL
jgi:hypothetical protein